MHQEEDGPPVARNSTTDIYALGMVREFDVYAGCFLRSLVHLRPCLCVIFKGFASEIQPNSFQEIISGNVPYSQYQFDVGVIRALDRKHPPKRPQELLGSREQSTRMWELLLQCWDHDPFARPDALSVLISVRVSHFLYFLNTDYLVLP